MRHSTNLDVLRACAVLLVFVAHACGTAGWNVMSDGTGRFGVILFFVHTSCVLMASMQSGRAEGGSWVTRFYIRRAFRIYPLSIAMVLLYLVVNGPIAPYGILERAPRTLPVVLSNLALVQNLTAAAPIIGVMWSLPVEVEMYVVLPLVFLLVQSRNWGRKMTVLWAGSAVLILAGQAAATRLFHGAHRLESLEFVPCFLAGAIAYRLPRPAGRWRSYWWVIFLGAIIWIGNQAAFNAPTIWACCLALAFLFARIADLPRNFFTRFCHLVAQYSYGIYLTHSLALWIFFRVLGSALHSPVLSLIGATLFMAAASVALFHLLEDPMIRLGKRVTGGGKSGPSRGERAERGEAAQAAAGAT